MRGYNIEPDDLKVHYLIAGISAACGLEDWACGTRNIKQIDCIDCRKWLVSAAKKGLRFSLK